MFNEFLGSGLMLMLVFLFMLPLVRTWGTVLMRTILEGFVVLFMFIVEVRRRD